MFYHGFTHDIPPLVPMVSDTWALAHQENDGSEKAQKKCLELQVCSAERWHAVVKGPEDSGEKNGDSQEKIGSIVGHKPAGLSKTWLWM